MQSKELKNWFESLTENLNSEPQAVTNSESFPY